MLKQLQGFLRRITSVGAAGRFLSAPWLLLFTRLYLGQIVFVHQIMAMAGEMHSAQAHGASLLPSALHAIGQTLVPLVLSIGLLTRPLALMLLLGIGRTGAGMWDTSSIGFEAVLLAWLIIAGPGAFALDHLLARGVSWSALRLAHRVRQLYDWIGRWLLTPLLVATRLSVAAIVAGAASQMTPTFAHAMGEPFQLASMIPTWCAVALAVALSCGIATRFAAIALATMIPIAGITMSMDGRLALLLVLLLLAGFGAGALSFDRLLSVWLDCKARDGDDLQETGPHVVVVGGGFGGIAAVRGLANAPCRVTLIDQRNHHLFQPLLYQVATAALSPAEIATPIRSLFRNQRNVRVQLGEVTGVDTDAGEVVLGASRVKFDYLVLATGARHSYFGKDDWAPFAPGLKSVEDATFIRSRLLRAFEEAENTNDRQTRHEWLTFVIVGGGPTGIELAGAIAELARHGMDAEYRSIDPATARVILVQAGPRLLPTFAPALSAAAERSLRSLGVEVELNAKVLAVDEEGAQIGGQRVRARTILWAAGVTASAAAKWLGQTSDPSGRVLVERDLRVPNLPNVYAIGDTACSKGWRGELVPGLAPAAKQQGNYVARAIRAALSQRPAPPPFEYRHFGSLATIGRQAAVAEVGKLRIWGAPAWWFWGMVHVSFLVGSRNRVTVMLDWMWAYLTYRRSTRLITGPSAVNEAWAGPTPFRERAERESVAPVTGDPA